MSWVILIIAGLLEVAWASVMPATDGFTKPVPTAAFLVLLGGSMYGLARASETIPVGTAYVVWVGIGAVGAATVGMVRGDPVTVVRLACLSLIVAGVVGLKVSAPH